MPSFRELLRARPGEDAILPAIDTRSTPGVRGRSAVDEATPALMELLSNLQEQLWVAKERSVLVVLQAMDTGGKDGTISHVFRAMNPQGIEVASFKAPTDEELAYHFLWRIDRRLPVPGEVVIFNRSHYEDVLVVRVHALVPQHVWAGRYEEINAWETEVVAAGTEIVKCFLHISYDEQRERLLARLDDPAKRWKFNEGDIDERARWNDYQAAYEDVIVRCSTDVAPWYVVPADRKWYRNWAVASLIAETLQGMDLEYPTPELDIERLKARLAPPN
jgi:PPK2 family polyphosphate:nucleotide phosphotransferase